MACIDWGLAIAFYFFRNHIKAYASFDEFILHLPEFKAKMVEQKICVEAENLDEASKLLKAKCDVVQCDKFSPELIKNVLTLRDEISQNTMILAAGGVNLSKRKRLRKCRCDSNICDVLKRRC